jgi:hypothetical protein
VLRYVVGKRDDVAKWRMACRRRASMCEGVRWVALGADKERGVRLREAVKDLW